VRAHGRGQTGGATRREVAVDHHVLDAHQAGNVHRLLIAGVLEDRVDVSHPQTRVGDRRPRRLHGKRSPVNALISEDLRVTDTHDG
jgi:hypothetical protein